VFVAAIECLSMVIIRSWPRMQAQGLIIRADASAEIGVGHVMRCLALAQAWQNAGGRVTFALHESPQSLGERLCNESCEVVRLGAYPGSVLDADQTIALAHRCESQTLVLDGSRFDADYQKRIKKAGLRLLLLDDYATAAHYYADWVWNADLPIRDEMYSGREPWTQLMLGPKYALLGDEFLHSHPEERIVPEVASRLLITMGGSDPQNMTVTAMHGLRHLKKSTLQVRVVIGSANPKLDLVTQEVKENIQEVEILCDVKDMAAQMAWADIAIAAVGVTLWELLYMGPAIVCWPRYPADVETVSSLCKVGAALSLGPDADGRAIASAVAGLMSNAGRRQRMCAEGRRIVDGLGAKRVVQALCAGSSCEEESSREMRV